jgi:hypothetical protein
MFIQRLTRILMLALLAMGALAPIADSRAAVSCHMACCRGRTSARLCRASLADGRTCACRCSMRNCTGTKTRVLVARVLTRLAPCATAPVLPALSVVTPAPPERGLRVPNRTPDFEDPPPRA